MELGATENDGLTDGAALVLGSLDGLRAVALDVVVSKDAL